MDLYMILDGSNNSHGVDTLENAKSKCKDCLHLVSFVKVLYFIGIKNSIISLKHIDDLREDYTHIEYYPNEEDAINAFRSLSENLYEEH